VKYCWIIQYEYIVISIKCTAHVYKTIMQVLPAKSIKTGITW